MHSLYAPFPEYQHLPAAVVHSPRVAFRKKADVNVYTLGTAFARSQQKNPNAQAAKSYDDGL